MVGAVVLALVAATAAAHEDLARSDPPGGSVVRTPPSRVTVTFPGELDANGSSITVAGPTGADVTGAGAGVDLDNPDRNTLVAPLAGDLSDGAYTVTWVALSLADGHETSGDFRFTVDPSAVEPASEQVAAPSATVDAVVTSENPTAANDDSSSDGSSNRTIYIVAGIAAAAVLGAVAGGLASAARKKQR